MGWPLDSFDCLSSPKRVDAHTLPVIFHIFLRGFLGGFATSRLGDAVSP